MDRKAQEIVYAHFFSYALYIALWYSKNQEDAVEIINDSFLKAFTQIDKFQKNKNFKIWLRTIVINTAIDKYRITIKNPNSYIEDLPEKNLQHFEADILDQFNAEDIFNLVQRIPEVYRFTFNLYEIEGYTHKEISKQLNITESKSRTNLSRAKKLIRKLMKENSSYETGS